MNEAEKVLITIQVMLDAINDHPDREQIKEPIDGLLAAISLHVQQYLTPGKR